MTLYHGKLHYKYFNTNLLTIFIQHLQTRKAVKITRNTWQYKDITENAEARGDVTE